MSQHFTVEFVCDSWNWNYMAEFQVWLRDKLESELFVDHFRSPKIEMLWSSVLTKDSVIGDG